MSTLEIFLFVQFIIGILTIIVILLQPNNSDGISTMSGSNSGLMSIANANNFFTRKTWILFFLFITNSIILGNLSARYDRKDQIKEYDQMYRNLMLDKKNELEKQKKFDSYFKKEQDLNNIVQENQEALDSDENINENAEIRDDQSANTDNNKKIDATNANTDMNSDGNNDESASINTDSAANQTKNSSQNDTNSSIKDN